jgi:hypothetical protein
MKRWTLVMIFLVPLACNKAGDKGETAKASVASRPSASDPSASKAPNCGVAFLQAAKIAESKHDLLKVITDQRQEIRAKAEDLLSIVGMKPGPDGKAAKGRKRMPVPSDKMLKQMAKNRDEATEAGKRLNASVDALTDSVVRELGPAVAAACADDVKLAIQGAMASANAGASDPGQK